MSLLLAWTATMLLAAPTESFMNHGKVAVTRIWKEAKYNAFTDLIKQRDHFYCVFREGTAHVYGEDGKIRVLRSNGGEQWESAGLIEESGVDLRDPKISVMPDGRLMLLIGGSVYEGRNLVRCGTRVCFAKASGPRFSAPVPVELDEAIRSDFDWLWRVTWAGETGYGVVYRARSGDDEMSSHLVSTRDGKTYRRITTFGIKGRPTEATLRIMPSGRMIALMRRDGGNHNGCVGISEPPYVEWSWNELEAHLGGPNFVRLPTGDLVAGTRSDSRTILARFDPGGDFESILTLPSGGDSSYPGMVVEDQTLWVSYYSSHEGQAAIYLAKVPLEMLAKGQR